MKKLMDGYVGVKFEGTCLSERIPDEAKAVADEFAATCDLLRRHDMTPANGGNVSRRLTSATGGEPAFAITASGCNLGEMEPHELIAVSRCDLDAGRVWYSGPALPSSETFLHHLIYRALPEVGAIVHAHDEPATRPELLAGEVEQTEREEPYGTIALARRAIETIRPPSGEGRRIIVLKNHGYVAVGTDPSDAAGLVVATHLRLLAKARGSSMK